MQFHVTDKSSIRLRKLTRFVTSCISVLTEVTVKSSVLYDVTPYSPVNVNQSLGETHFLHLHVRRKITWFVVLAAYLLLIYCFA
jgi:hypothetical protein